MIALIKKHKKINKGNIKKILILKEFKKLLKTRSIAFSLIRFLLRIIPTSGAKRPMLRRSRLDDNKDKKIKINIFDLNLGNKS